MSEIKTTKKNTNSLSFTVKLLASSLKRTLLTAPYWVDMFQTFKFFVATRQNILASDPLTWFRYHDLVFGVRPLDWFVMESILLEQEYKLLDHVFLDRTPNIVIDAGANIGLFSIYALSAWPAAEVFAIEACSGTYAILEQTRKKNARDTWHTYHYALWNQDGEVPFESSGLSIDCHVLEDSGKNYVPAIRLDSFMEKNLPENSRVSLLKMDIEGSEENVLQACPEVLERVETILIEVHPDMCAAEAVLSVLYDNFPYIYDISGPDTPYPVLFASRWVLPEDEFRFYEISSLSSIKQPQR